MALDERLRRELDQAAHPADPSGVYEDLIRRKERRRLLRRARTAGLALAVLFGIGIGLLGLSRVFQPSSQQAGSGETNGRIAFANFEREGGFVTAPTWHIYTMEPDGSDVTFEGPLDVDEALYPSYSPDGGRIAFAGFTGEPKEHALYTLDVATKELTKILVMDPGQQIEGVEWSPDSTTIGLLLTENVPIEPPPEIGPPETQMFTAIWTIAPDGSDLRQVTSVGREGPFSWSPDGSEIAFSRYAAETSSDGFVDNDIYVIQSDGTDERRLTQDGVSMSPAWSPDGSLFVFESYDRERSGELDLYVMNVDGSNRRRLTTHPGSEFGAIWSPDGTLVAYSERTADPVGSRCYVSTISPSGTERTRLFGSSDEVGCPRDVAWAAAPTRESGETTELPTPTPQPNPSSATGEDIGLGFSVCNLSSIDGRFVSPDARATAFAATRAGDTGGCPQADEGFNVLALDVDRDGLAESSFGPIECELECRTFAAPDIDGDGTDELLVVQGGGAVVRAHLYDIASTETDPSIVSLIVAAPGDPEGGFDPGEQATFLVGGDAFELYGVRCGDVPDPDGPGVIATRAESLPHDSPDAAWHAHQTTLVGREDGVMHVVDVRDFTEPVTDDPAGPSFRSGETLCGSNLGP